MAARRLLIVMLVLLGISTLAAALVPPQAVRDDDTGSTAAEETETEAPDPLPSGEDLGILKLRVGGREIPVVGSKDDPVRVGDHLELHVSCACSDLLEIPALGLIAAVAPGSPARFDLLFPAAGSYGIRLTSADRVVGRIEVANAAPAAKSRAREGSARP